MRRIKASTSFGPLEIAFDRRVLEPRAWTKLQSEWAAEVAPALVPGPILELCAGAGHIGLLAAALTGRDLVQVEADPIAATFAAENAAAVAGVTAEVRNAAMSDALWRTERFPLILADPPYIPTGDLDSFPDDPRFAIDGGEDGLDVVRDCIRIADEHLAAEGILLLQLRGAAQAEQVATLLEQRWPAFEVREIRTADSERAVALITRTAIGRTECRQNG